MLIFFAMEMESSIAIAKYTLASYVLSIAMLVFLHALASGEMNGADR